MHPSLPYLHPYRESEKDHVCSQEVMFPIVMALWRKSFSCLFRKNPEFQVDFYEYPKENATIAFHFPVYTSNVVVMNSIQKGLWNEKNVAFSALVLDNQYQVFVNGKSTYMFAHSLLPQSVKMVQVKGDTFLTSVDIL
uniref:Galectin n=1 Tax=Piliocolobus tephrosceles TaxID=591936 RepID=A0A8C9IZA5_9PRIM